MSDQSNSSPNYSWMEPVLKQHLGRVQAPAGLWNRLPVGTSEERTLRNRFAWAAAAAVFLIGGALGSHSYVRHTMALQAASAESAHRAAPQAGAKFAVQAACQVCHLAGEL
jgi:hypothetical protein